MDATTETIPDSIRDRAARCRPEGFDRHGGGVLLGSPADLSALCRWLGFKNPCARGRVYLAGDKMRAIGVRPAA